MSLPFYLRTAATAAKYIKRFGREAQLRRRVYGEIEDRSCWVIRTVFDPRHIDGELIQYNDHRYLMAQDVSTPPDPQQDRLVIGSDELRVVTSTPLQPADVVMLYDVQARL